MLQTTYDEALTTQATKNGKNKAVLNNAGGGGVDNRIRWNIENLSTIVNLAKKVKID